MTRPAALLLTLALAGPALADSIPAFPGAEGFGANATGGREGTIVHVTNLNDAGPGSFRDAVSQPDRIILFSVAGVIKLESPVSIKSNLTIAGESAPAPGITLSGDTVSFSNSTNIIARYLRCRMGETGTSGKDAVAFANTTTAILDHFSVSFGRDENLSVTGTAKNITLQNCIIGQGLQPHSCGGLIQADGVSILRTLYINNHTRNAKIKVKNQYVNNVVYNWGAGAYIAGDSEGRTDATLLNSYFIQGPSKGSSPITRSNENFHIFAAGNLYDDNRNGKLDGSPLENKEFGKITWTDEPAAFPKIATILSAQEAYSYILEHAGASLTRDPIDTRLLADLASLGTAGSTTIKTVADFPAKLDLPTPPTPAEAPKDTDNDGMPDAFESAHNLNPNDPADAKKLDPSGYSMIEIYLHSLAK